MAKTKQARDLDNFEDIGSLTAEDIREPDLYPTGPWTIRNIGYSVSDSNDRDGNPQKVYNLRYEGFEPGPEVDPELLELGGFEGRTLWHRRYVSMPAAKAARDGTLARLINFVEMHGVDTVGRNVTEMLSALKGATIQAQIGTKTFTNREGEEVRDNTIGEFSSVA